MSEPKTIQDYRAIEESIVAELRNQCIDGSFSHGHTDRARAAKDLMVVAGICRDKIMQWEEPKQSERAR